MKRAFTALILSLTLLLTACDGPSYQAEELRGDPSSCSSGTSRGRAAWTAGV